ncbi:MAG: hypothetical protein ACPGF7_14535 [Pontibacterium sp.]
MQPITGRDLELLEDFANKQFSQYSAKFVFSFHFTEDRLNDLRNNPPINIDELEDIFFKLAKNHADDVVVLPDGAKFTVKCETSHINIPFVVEVDEIRENIAITIMRHKNFKAHDGDSIFTV